MQNNDIRWKQRFHNYSKALSQLQKFIDKGELNELEEQGLIQAFEYTYELAWNTIKDYYSNQGVIDIQGSRDAFKLAANRDLIKNVELWMEMVNSRIKTTHTYNEEIAREIADAIVEHYHPMFIQLQTRLQVEFLRDE
ncbi:nucleotidyltransferase substrate binding protein [Arcticibacter eurypsychrophilus]|uniref:nucleotidyltransferase substrate binding protein n=1 Tax=Arcticibacter eurypsychrophilus TaxID=1434752 RepID=UPI00084D01B9|nr:nucleotidyltransferase substrate binding protein [Arcticibacter eurypsychrophilus]